MNSPNRRKSTIALALTAAVLYSAPLVWAQSPVAIANAGFEDPVLGDGGVGTPADWTAVAGGGDLYNPTTGEFAGEAPEGDNVLSIFSGADGDGFSLMLDGATGQLQVGATYALTVQVGDPDSAAFDGYKVQLLANGAVLAEDDNTVVPAVGTWATATVNYVYNPADVAHVGFPLEIRLLTKGLLSGDTEFDDVQLTVALGSAIANPGGPYKVSNGGSLSLDGSGSLPSDGETISLYEWDVDNDGTYDVVGVTPAAITDADLMATYGMSIGANTIVLRVTDTGGGGTVTALGTVNLSAPIAGQLGVLDLDANGGINPNTGVAWVVGDQYRLAFHTDETINAMSNETNVYDDFAAAQAATVPALAGTYWTAMVYVNTDPDQDQGVGPISSPRDRSGTVDETGGSGQGGAGVPVFAMDGTTSIARNNADIYNSWSNPFDGDAVIRLASGTTNNNSDGSPVTATQNVHYSPFLDQFGLGDTANVHGANCWTAGFGGSVNPLGDTPNEVRGSWGSSNANNTGRVWNRFNSDTTALLNVYAISMPLTVIDLNDSVDPNFVSIVDDKGGADVIAGVDTVVYSVSFDEGMNPATVDLTDFEILGTAAATISRVDGTVDPAVFEVTVMPTTGGTIQLQIAADAVLEDFVGNTVDTIMAIPDDTIITVIDDVTDPNLASIVDDIAGDPIVAFNGLTYTVTFDEDIDPSTLDIADFGNNGGTATITVDSVTATGDPKVFEVAVTTTGPGSLIFEIVLNAVITDLVGNPLDTDPALPDDTTITVTADPLPTLVAIDDNQGGGPVFSDQTFTYFVSFDTVMDPASVDVTDFEGGSPAATIDQVLPTGDPMIFAVDVTPGGAGTITLQISLGAVITNQYGTELDAGSASPDDTTITVDAGLSPAREVITVDEVKSGNSGSSPLSVDFDMDISMADKVVVILTGENGNPGSMDGNVTSVTLDGKPMTQVVDRNPIPTAPSATFDQTYNDIWYIDIDASYFDSNPAAGDGVVSASINSRGNITAFALSGTAPGVAGTAISAQESKSVNLSVATAGSIVIASHGMGGNGNSANVNSVDADAPLTEASAHENGNIWDGHVTAYALAEPATTYPYAFTGGNLVGTHTIAAAFPAALVVVGGNDYDNWAAGPFLGTLTDSTASLDFDGGGLRTGVEWVVGGDPTDPSDDAGLTPTSTDDGTYLVFTYIRTDAANDDPNTTIAVEYGSNLTGWTTAVNAVNGVIINVTPDSPSDIVEVKIPKTEAVNGLLFARLNVVITP